jgi:hypothetical protein
VAKPLTAAFGGGEEKGKSGGPCTLSPGQRSPRPAKGLAAPLNPACSTFEMPCGMGSIGYARM